ncbi:MAG: 5-formyltetrahydrofolate cyclo-ligase [Stellaceae bacterium]
MTGAPADLVLWRRERRKEIQAARQALGPDEHRGKARRIAARLDEFMPRLQGKLVGIYWPIRREFDPLPWARRFLAAGGAVALPVVVAKRQPLEFRAWRPGAAMAAGVYDIPYPADGPAVLPQALVVALLGFDEAGYRLGYGAGFYDRTFASFAAKPFALGVGFELGRLATIFPQPHDVPMDEILTESGAFRRDAGRLVPTD